MPVSNSFPIPAALAHTMLVNVGENATFRLPVSLVHTALLEIFYVVEQIHL